MKACTIYSRHNNNVHMIYNNVKKTYGKYIKAVISHLQINTQIFCPIECPPSDIVRLPSSDSNNTNV